MPNPLSASARREDPVQWATALAETLVKSAKGAGAKACDATVGVGASLSAKARDGAVEDVSRSSSCAAGIRVIVDGRLGFATAAEAPHSQESADELAKSAVALARISSPSDHNLIPQATAPTGETLREEVERLKLYDEATAELDAGWAADRALEMEKILVGEKDIATVRDVGAGARRGVFALATSTGFSGGFRGCSVSLSASGIVNDQDHKKQVGGWWTAARTADALEATERVAKQAADRARARLGARKVASCKAPVIFDPSMARGFVGAVLGAINGESVARRASFLAEKKGEVIWIENAALVDDPSIPGALGSTPFDGEGLKVERQTLIDNDGRLLTWLLDARSASKLGESPRGHAQRGSSSQPGPGVTNVVLEGGEGDLDSIIAETERGLLVTQLLGHGPDMVTGEYSRGASGFWIEDGAIAFPVEEVTIAGEMVDMMRSIDRIGTDVEQRSSMLIPTIRFSELAISGSNA